VKKYLLEKYGIKSTFLLHPFFPYLKSIGVNKILKRRKGALSISRVDYDKHTEIIIEANKILKMKNKPIIDIYGSKNDRYVYYILSKYDSMKDTDPNSSYKGTFEKSFEKVHELLRDKKFVVDMSAIRYDGGGSQYTFLEAIYEGCILILNEKWLDGKIKSKFIPGENCFIVKNGEELAKLIIKNPNVKEMVQESKDLLKPHISVNWKKIF